MLVSKWSRSSAAIVAALLLLQAVVPPRANGQFGKLKERIMKTAVCGNSGMLGGYKLGDKIAEFETKRLKLSPQAAAAMKRQYEIGVAMALCNGGPAVEGTAFARMSDRDKKKRQDEMDAAVADAAPGSKTYALPDHPDMSETITTEPTVAENTNECRVVQDHLAEGDIGDSALVKYCHKPPDGQWTVSTGVWFMAAVRLQKACGPGMLLACLLAAPSLSRALLFEPLDTANGSVLLIRDCGLSQEYASRGFSNNLLKIMQQDDAKGCKPWQTEFYAQDEGGYTGDANQLRAELAAQQARGRRFAEIWLFSDGGQVEAAIEMARIFRANQLSVRLKPGFYCVSACTIAFMGGYFRYMDDGSTYQVHSASTVLSAFVSEDKKINPWVKKVIDDPDKGLQEFARIRQASSRFMAIRILRVFQNTLILPLGKMLSENDDAFEQWAEADVPPWDYRQAVSTQRAADVARIESEGASAIQDILMRVEREAMQNAIAELGQRISALGPRAGAALRMIKLMYMTSIKETSVLSKTTMLEMGYLTEEFHPQ